MAVDYSIRVEGQDEIERALAGLVKQFGNLQPLMERFGIVLETSTIERFDTETDPTGHKWLPSLRVRHSGGKTLTLSGRMRQSIRSIAHRSQVEIGTNVKYARAHQEGFDGDVTVAAHTRRMTQVFGRKLASPIDAVIPSFKRHMKMPKRAFLGLSSDDREELAAQVTDYVAEVAPEVEQ